jgi:proteasome accessory factor B
VRLTTTQLVALRLAIGQMRALAGTGLHEDLVAVCEELEATLRGADHEHARSLDKKLFDVGEAPYDYTDRVDDLDAIVTALLKEEGLRVTHAGTRGLRTFRVDPYTLMVYRRGLYLVGFSHEHAARRTFGLDALSNIEWLKGESFAYPETYDPSQLVDGAFGIIGGERTHVRLRFSAKVARYVTRRRWHPTLAIARGDDGSVEATMDVAGTEELKTWVLGFGSECEIVEPPRLREEIAGTLRAALGKYGG